METRGFADASSPFLQVGFSKGGQSTPLWFTTIEVCVLHVLRGERSLVKLIFNDQSGWERSVELNDQNNVLMIGRNADCGIQTNNASVSRVHAMVTWRNGKLFVQDPPNGRPTNGTKVDGMRLEAGEVLELFAGSELLCGNFAIRVAQDDNQGSRVPQMGEQAMQIPPAQGKPIVYTTHPQQQQQAVQMYQNNPRMGHQAPGGRGTYAQDMRGQRGMQPMPPQGQPMQAQQMQQQAQPMQAQQMQAQPMQQPQGQPMGQSGADNARINRGRAPQGYSHSTPQAPGQQHSAPNAQDAEMAKLQEENGRLRQQIEELRTGTVSNDDSVRELQNKLEERNQILTDYERRIEFHDTVVTGLKDMIDKLKEQLEHQKEQYQECRRDLVTAQDESESLRLELSTLKETLESKGMATSNAETTIADLKVQLQQKIRLLSDLQRELDLSQFSCKEERENVERLKENIETLNESLEESQRRNRDMKKVVEQHEMMFSELKGNLDDRAREIRQLQDSLRAKGGADSAALMQEISVVRDALNKKSSECEMLQKQLRNAEESVNASAGSESEIANLKSKLAETESAAALAAAKADSKAKSLQEEIDALKEELHQAGQSGASEGGGDSALLELLRGIYEELNDIICQWRSDMQSLEDSISDIQRVFVAYVKIDVKSLQPQERARLENVLKDHDPKVIFEYIGAYLDAGQNALAMTKEKLKTFRNALQP